MYCSPGLRHRAEQLLSWANNASLRRPTVADTGCQILLRPRDTKIFIIVSQQPALIGLPICIVTSMYCSPELWDRAEQQLLSWANNASWRRPTVADTWCQILLRPRDTKIFKIVSQQPALIRLLICIVTSMYCSPGLRDRAEQLLSRANNGSWRRPPVAVTGCQILLRSRDSKILIIVSQQPALIGLLICIVTSM
jgi:hypothetical protein